MSVETITKPTILDKDVEKINKSIENAELKIKHLVLGEESKIDFQLPAAWEVVPKIRKTIMKNFDFPKEKREDYEICLGEAINNVLEHGAKLGNPLNQKNDLTKLIEFDIVKTSSELIINIISPGQGFDYKKIEKEAKKFKEKRIKEMQAETQKEDLSKLKASPKEIDQILKNIKESEFHLGEEGGRGSVIQAFVNEGTAKYKNQGKTIELRFKLI